MLSLSLITVPVLLSPSPSPSPSPSHLLLSQWARMYHYGFQMTPTAAIGTFLIYTYISIAKQRARKPWRLFMLAGLTTLSIIPFTLLVMLPTNNELFRLEGLGKQLEGKEGGREMEEVKGLVRRWSWLHVGRSLLPLVGAVLGMVGTLGGEVGG